MPEEVVGRGDDLLKEAMFEKMVRPSQRKGMGEFAVQGGQRSIRPGCQTFQVSETCYRRYQGKARQGIGAERERLRTWGR